MKTYKNQNGSALVVVLGMLAVLMLMAVAFSVIMRTERSGVTNMKHALIAKQTMQTALSRVMVAIDRSFLSTNGVVSNWPVQDWDQPYLASKNVSPYYHSGICPDDKLEENARILTEEISRHLSPAQYALARNAMIGWVPVRSGVESSEDDSEGRVKADKVVGRYAFLALDTTGLLDMNLTNAASFKLEGTDFVSTYPRFLDWTGAFTSYADMRRLLAMPENHVYKDFYKADTIIAPDLFNTFSTSLEEVAPDGTMKIPLSALTERTSSADKTAYAKKVLKAFEKIFKDNGEDPSKKFDPYPDAVPMGMKSFTRAQLATQALIDYTDRDVKPCGGIDSGDDGNYLNYPCTEPVPMISHVLAWFDPDVPPQTVPATLPADSYHDYKVELTIRCTAQYLNKEIPADRQGDNDFRLKMDFKFADPVHPDDNPSGDVYTVKDAFKKMWGAGTKDGGWEFVYKSATGEAAMDAFIQAVQDGGDVAPVSKDITEDDRIIDAEYKATFNIRAYAKVDVSGLLTEYREFSMPQESGSTEKSIFTAVLATAKVSEPNDGIVQQVPAKALDRDERFHVKVFPGLYHKAGERNDALPEMGWAFCVDPRFAYDTGSLYDPPGARYCFWLNNSRNAYQAIRDGAGGDYPIFDMFDLIFKREKSDHDIAPDGSLGNYLINKVFFAKTPVPTVQDVRKRVDAFSSDWGIYPDSFHSPLKTPAFADLFIESDDINYLTKYDVANTNMTSVGELGNLVVGPWETLSLFHTFRPDGKKDFHKAVDYFSKSPARSPTPNEFLRKDLEDLNVEHYPALHQGLVNLNAQPLIICPDVKHVEAQRGEPLADLNYDPLRALLVGKGVVANFDKAGSLLDAFYLDTRKTDVAPSNTVREMVRNLSDLGNVNWAANSNAVLSCLVELSPGINCDADREVKLGKIIDGVTTRGQTYLVIIRADAYSPKYGSDSSSDGTTMASAHALVELWRDPEPCRLPDGQLLDMDTPTHNWYVRSVRWF